MLRVYIKSIADVRKIMKITRQFEKPVRLKDAHGITANAKSLMSIFILDTRYPVIMLCDEDVLIEIIDLIIDEAIQFEYIEK